MSSDIDVNGEQWAWQLSGFSLGGGDEHRQWHHLRSDRDARRQVKRFFTWFMQSSQILVAGLISVLAAIGKKSLSLEALSYIWRQIVSISLFKRRIFQQAVSELQISKPKSEATIPNRIYVCSNWTSSIEHGIRDERRVRVQPRNEGIIVCAFL